METVTLSYVPQGKSFVSQIRHKTFFGDRSKRARRNPDLHVPVYFRNVYLLPMQIRILTSPHMIVRMRDVISKKRLFSRYSASARHLSGLLRLLRFLKDNVLSQHWIVFSELETVRGVHFVLFRIVNIRTFAAFHLHKHSV